MKEKLRKLLSKFNFPAIYYVLAGGMLMMGITFIIIGRYLNAVNDALFFTVLLLSAEKKRESETTEEKKEDEE